MQKEAAFPMHFGRIVISPAERAISVDGRTVGVGPRAFDVLLALAERRERLVSREELLALVWPGVVVEDHNITAQVSSLRKLLGAKVIATVPGRGYRFIAPAERSAVAQDAALAQVESPRHPLPTPRSRFIGREAPLTEVKQLLTNNPLVTVTGIGGSGKTRLALEVARRSLDDNAGGVWFVDLAPLASPERVTFACASVFGLGDEDEASLIDHLGGRLGDRRALIVLDNCEHVRSGVARLVDALLARTGGTRVLATSREPLAVAGEQVYPLHPLVLPATDRLEDVRAADAARLFVDRARLAMPAFDIDASNAAAIGEVCRRLDGIALAIELAAARVPLLSVAEIAARLGDRFRFLPRGTSTVPRQQTLAATMQWSYDQLDPAAQRLFRLLSVFVGGFTLESAAAIAGLADDYEALALVTTLYDKSLLTIDHGSAGPRYGMLETVRQYACERLDECGETEAAQMRHLQYFLALTESAAAHLDGPRQSKWMERLRAEHGNLALALTRCGEERAAVDPSWGLRLAAASSRYWLFNEVEAGCRLAVGVLRRDRGNADSESRFKTLRGLSAMYMHRGQGAAGLPYAREALALARQAGNPAWQAMAHNAIGTCLDRAGDEAAGLHEYEEARGLARSSGSAATLSAVLNNIAGIDFRRGDLAVAERGFREALHLMRGEGNVRSALIFLHNLVRVCVAAGKLDDARASAVEAQHLLEDVVDVALKLELIEVTAGLAARLGEHDLAARWWGFACQRLIDQGYRRPPVDEDQLVLLAAESREALGGAKFDQAERTGWALELDTAMSELGAWLEGRASGGRHRAPS